MPTFKRLVSAVETAEQIKNKWSHNESKAVDIVMLSPENANRWWRSTNDDDNRQWITKWCLWHSASPNKLFEWEDNNDEVEDDNNTELKAQNENKKRMLELFKDEEKCKTRPRSWINKILV